MSYSVHCGNGRCNYWLGESSEPLVYVESVAKGEHVTIPAPRDVRICKGCGHVAIFVPRSSLDLRRVEPTGVLTH